MAPRSRGILGCPDRLPTAREVCDGEAGFWVNLLLFPFVLLWNATSIYIIPCFQVLGRRFYRAFCRSCVDSCCGPWVFTDTEFEGPAAIGTSGGQQADWVRAVDLLADKKDANGKPLKPKLYEGGITPGDLAQGAVGDCWLVAALACVAEYPDAIRKVFLTPEYNSRGIYRVRLFDATKGAWVVVTVDDRIPCKPGTKQPLFMKLQGCELWAVLLEKAFAKFCGSYGALDGGWAMWGWRALTGDNVFRLRLDGDQWKRIDFEMKRATGEIDGTFRATRESHATDDVWKLILNYMEDRSLVAASGGKQMGGGGGPANAGGLNGEQLNEAAGLVGTHAYSILDARELGLLPGVSVGGGLLGQTKLIKLRNPWGRYEWKGAWSDGSKEWDENPIIKLRLRPKDEDDGCFWMPWDKFYEAGFTQIDICDRTTKDDLRLDVNEDRGPCGLALGATCGCARFFCLCGGVRQLYFGKRSSKRTKSTKRGCERCTEPSDVAEPGEIQIVRG